MKIACPLELVRVVVGGLSVPPVTLKATTTPGNAKRRVTEISDRCRYRTGRNLYRTYGCHLQSNSHVNCFISTDITAESHGARYAALISADVSATTVDAIWDSIDGSTVGHQGVSLCRPTTVR